jgi:hypothetical protein
MNKIPLLSIVLLFPQLLLAGDRPPADARPASEVARAVSAMNVGEILELEFDDNHWEAKTHQDGRELELRLDRIALKETARSEKSVSARVQPITGEKSLADLLAAAESKLPGPISEVEFENGRWEIDFWDNDKESKGWIDPKSGELHLK